MKNLNISQNIDKIISLSSLPRPETELLLAFLLDKSREFLLTHPETLISPAVYQKLQGLEKKRLQDWPLAYLTGHKEFYGLDFRVGPSVLVPRPETEMIVDKVLDLLASERLHKLAEPDRRHFRPLIIDLGTGSGAIIIAIAAELKRSLPLIYRQTAFWAVDISQSALSVAVQNSQSHKLSRKIRFYRSDLLTSLKRPRKLELQMLRRDLIITANLPYLTPRQIKEAPSISREPKLALAGGPDGLRYYRLLFKQLKGLARHSLTVFCEIDPSQAGPIAILAAKYFPGAQQYFYQDYSGQDRLFMIRCK